MNERTRPAFFFFDVPQNPTLGRSGQNTLKEYVGNYIFLS